MEYLNDEEKRKINMCLANIVDCIRAIQLEVMGDKAYKGYLHEKAVGALTDIRVIVSICEEET